MNKTAHYSLDDLTRAYPANMHCESCLRTTILSTETQRSLLGEDRGIKSLYGRMTCSCGSTSFFLRVTYGPLDVQQILIDS